MKRLRGLIGNDRLILSLLALGVGGVGGGAVIVFREAIALVQTVFYGSGTERLYTHAEGLAWWHLLLAPAVGGLVVGVLVHRFMGDRRNRGPADVIEASVLRGGRMPAGQGVLAAALSAASIGVGASVGREGPAVHLGASLGGWLAGLLKLPESSSRTMLGCGVAAAVAASFNAPIAGVLFAAEVVIGHHALKVFAPIVIASVTGTVVSRAYFGDVPAFATFDHAIQSVWEFPAFAGLGVVSGLAAVVFMRAVMVAQAAADRSPLPSWLRPAFGGLGVGALAVVFPQVLGVGYGTTESALLGSFPLGLLAALLAAKIVATALSIGFGFGGGVFSPSLVIGALLGGVYGTVFSQAFPLVSPEASAYVVVGMGAVAASVLGAPISTTLIVFEMTGDYPLTMGVMVAVVLAAVVTEQLHGRSFFTWQLEHRGIDLGGGIETALPRAPRVGDLGLRECEVVAPDVGLAEIKDMLRNSATGELFVVDGDGSLFGTIAYADINEVAFDQTLDDLVKAADVARMNPPLLAAGDDLETALGLFRDAGESHVAVVADQASKILVGCLDERDVMNAYNQALVESLREERGG